MVRFFFSPLKSQPTSHPTDRFFSSLLCWIRGKTQAKGDEGSNIKWKCACSEVRHFNQHSAHLSITRVRNTAKWHAICPFVLPVAVASFSLPKPDCTRQIIVLFSGKDRLNAHIPRMVLHFRVGITCETKSWMLVVMEAPTRSSP